MSKITNNCLTLATVGVKGLYNTMQYKSVCQTAQSTRSNHKTTSNKKKTKNKKR